MQFGRDGGGHGQHGGGHRGLTRAGSGLATATVDVEAVVVAAAVEGVAYGSAVLAAAS